MGDIPSPVSGGNNARPEHGSPRPARAQLIQEPRQLHHYRRDSIASNASFYSEVEMAQNEVCVTIHPKAGFGSSLTSL